MNLSADQLRQFNERIVRVAQWLASQVRDMWQFSLPLFVCLGGGLLWKVADAHDNEFGVFLAIVCWSWALCMAHERGKAQGKDALAHLFAKVLVEGRNTTIEIEHRYPREGA